ncbi:TetR/AcrR family transcriptional regulator [Herbidospora cretacea]|uniref:TetR/AcrR family transcriptional regulator n=1 Tax=Herbidospora cretacea TaxID=28444 RepID=UPI0007748366|nr:TetR/AcrR family transcriptional regulator [Herbidospora cretacea]
MAADGRLRLVLAAEELFADRGVDAVSLREINAAAGQRNASALQYHFGDRDGLLRAVLARHDPPVEYARHALLDAFEAAPPAEPLRALAGAFVRPLAAKLADVEGRRYLRLLDQVVRRASPSALRASTAQPTSVNRWREMVGPLLPEIAVTRLHRRLTAIRMTYSELARRAETSEGRDERLFTSHVIDVVASVLATPVSAETAALLG